MKLLAIYFIFSFGFHCALDAQSDFADRLVQPDTLARDSIIGAYEFIVVDGDTIRIFDLPRVSIFPKRVFSSRGEQRRYDRLIINVKRVYPYAKLAGQKFLEYQKIYDSLPTRKERRRAMKKAEEELREQFEEELKGLTFSQGVILIKLIDRETRHTSYNVVKEFRGFFAALVWQGLGRLFGFNLKTKYDPDGEDALIEEIVQQIELGYLPLP
jgi:hypothetical protein